MSRWKEDPEPDTYVDDEDFEDDEEDEEDEERCEYSGLLLDECECEYCTRGEPYEGPDDDEEDEEDDDLDFNE